MAERSILWDTNGVGDGLVGGYTEADLDLVDRMLWSNDPTTQGVSLDYLNSLEITNPAGVNLSMDTGGGVVYGHPYWNTVAVVLALVAPVINTTGWRWVLRASWAAQTVRAVLLQSADGVAAIPALTQVAGVTWEISLAQGTITVALDIAITDDRVYLEPGILIDQDHMQDRTMTFMVQAVSAEVGGALVVRVNERGWICNTAVSTNCYGGFKIPDDADLTQPFLVDLIFNYNVPGAFNVNLNSIASFGSVGESYVIHFLPLLNVVIAVGPANVITLSAGNQLDLQPLGNINDYVSLKFYRDGAAGSDTFTGILYFMGWRIQYTRDH